MEWSEFCKWLQGKVVTGQDDIGGGRMCLEFNDGSSATIESNFDAGYSEYTPGEGIQVPTVEVTEPSR